MKDGAFQRAEQVCTEGKCQNLIRRKWDVAQAKALQEAIVDVVVATFAHHGEARVHESVEVSVYRAPDAIEVLR